MDIKKIQDKRIFILIFVLLVLGSLYIYRNFLPILTYAITLDTNQENSEKPLEIGKIEKDIISYTFSIKSQKDSVKGMELKINRMLTNKFPFIDYGNNINLVLTIKEIKQTKETDIKINEPIKSYLYTINGTLSNLKERDYKIRVEDQFGNLIDEQTISLKPEAKKLPPKIELSNPTQETTQSQTSPQTNTNPMIACETNDDCVPVSCACSCSGCGGFSYQDIVNKKYKELWYFEHDCKEPQICPQVCCPKAEIDCENKVCTVKTEESLIEIDK